MEPKWNPKHVVTRTDLWTLHMLEIRGDRETYNIMRLNFCVFLTKDGSLEENSNGYQAHLICINWDVVHDQLSGFKPLLILRRAAIYITILGYTLFLYGLTFFYISFHSFFLRNWKQREIEGNLKVISNQYESCSISLYSPFFPFFFCK